MIKIILISLVLIIAGCRQTIYDNLEPPQVTNFEECVKVTGIVLESYPAQCEFNGKTFTEEIIIDISDPEPPIPGTVLLQYNQLAYDYRESFGANLDKCIGPDLVYRVTGSGGYTGTLFYYDANGDFLGELIVDDVIVDGEPEPPIDESKYVCTEIKRSK